MMPRPGNIEELEPSMSGNVKGSGRRPLFGKRVVITRAREQAADLRRLLEASGAQVLQFPMIETGPPSSFETLDRTLDGLADYQWLVFSSVNGVKSFFARMEEKGRDAGALAGCLVAAVGDTTAAELRAAGIAPDLVPDKFQSIALLPHFEGDQSALRMAVVRAAKGKNDFIDEMRRRGATVDLAIAYETRAAESDLSALRALIEEQAIDVVTFTSASTVDQFFAKLTPAERAKVNAQAILASIGPVTSEAIRRYGKSADVEAASASVQALHDAVVERLATHAMRRIEVPWANVLVLADDRTPQVSLVAMAGELDPSDWRRPWFSEAELAFAASLARWKRRDEWLLSRIAAKELAVTLGVSTEPQNCNVDDQRRIVGDRRSVFVSLSHSENVAAAAIGDSPVGVDVQVVRELSPRAAHLFLSDEESGDVARCSIAERLLHFWCAKEAAWKALGGTAPTLKHVPLALVSESETGLRFDRVETIAVEGVIVAVTRPIS